MIYSKGDHFKDVQCSDCHLAGASVTKENAHQLIGTQEKLCGRCHGAQLTVSHPSGFAVQRTLPPEYPLDWKGDITCSTCHEVHGNGRGLMRGEKRGKQLCLSCHEEAFFLRMADEGVSIRQTSHIVAAPEGEVLLDSYSMHCMGCHDNFNRRYPGSEDGIVLAHGDSTMKHPIGLAYDSVLRKGRFRSPSGMSDKIIFPDGKLSCVSCHQAYSDVHGELVVPNGGSKLCFQCHDL